jgi:ABC-type molybdenum transport system ATPase subunit/photorepair protein PhrA
LSAVRWVIEHEASISNALLSSLLKEYPSLQSQYGYCGKEKAELMPDVKSAEDLRALIGLSSVNVHQVQKDGTRTRVLNLAVPGMKSTDSVS